MRKRASFYTCYIIYKLFKNFFWNSKFHDWTIFWVQIDVTILDLEILFRFDNLGTNSITRTFSKIVSAFLSWQIVSKWPKLNNSSSSEVPSLNRFCSFEKCLNPRLGQIITGVTDVKINEVEIFFFTRYTITLIFSKVLAAAIVIPYFRTHCIVKSPN